MDVPSLLSFLATGDFNSTVKGVNDLQAEYEKTYGPGNYTPNIPLAYWSFRLMIGFGAIGFFLALFTPLLGEFALKFGAYEFFWLAVFGVIISATPVRLTARLYSSVVSSSMGTQARALMRLGSLAAIMVQNGSRYCVMR